MLGRYIDSVWSSEKDAHPALFDIAGIQFTVLSIIVLGAVSLNPKLLFDEDLAGEVTGGSSDGGSNEGLGKGNELKKRHITRPVDL